MKITKKEIYLFIFMCIGNIMLGMGIAFLRLAAYGTDPYSCMNIGLSGQLSISYGTCQLIVNIILFIPVILVIPKSFGIGTFVNMIGIGYIVDFIMWILGEFGITIEMFTDKLPIRIVFVIVGILVLCLGIGMYMECNMGYAPYDAVGLVLEKVSGGKLTFRWMRVMADVICMVVGFLSGGAVGIVTVVVAFFTGPLVSWYRTRFARLVMKIENH